LRKIFRKSLIINDLRRAGGAGRVTPWYWGSYGGFYAITSKVMKMTRAEAPPRYLTLY